MLIPTIIFFVLAIATLLIVGWLKEDMESFSSYALFALVVGAFCAAFAAFIDEHDVLGWILLSSVFIVPLIILSAVCFVAAYQDRAVGAFVLGLIFLLSAYPWVKNSIDVLGKNMPLQAVSLGNVEENGVKMSLVGDTTLYCGWEIGDTAYFKKKCDFGDISLSISDICDDCGHNTIHHYRHKMTQEEWDRKQQEYVVELMNVYPD